MEKIPFDEKEMEILDEIPAEFEELPPMRVYNRPISNKENWKLLYRDKHPMWVPYDIDNMLFCPAIYPDAACRALVMEAVPFDPITQAGGPDMYGTEWVYQPENNGSMVVPGEPRIKDMNDWKDIITRPDIDSWDWEGCAAANKEYLNSGYYNIFQILTGWFERMISLMDFSEAALALIDEDQEDAVHEFLDATSEDMCKMIDKIATYFPEIDEILIHDDWGGQASPFFSQETAMEMIVPHMKKVTDHIHSKGMTAQLHSCGHGESRIEAFIAAGWDAWEPQPMNDIAGLYEKYGDKILLMLDPGMPEDATEEQQKVAARTFARRFCRPGKIALPGGEHFICHRAFEEEFYRETRRIFLEQ